MRQSALIKYVALIVVMLLATLTSCAQTEHLVEPLTESIITEKVDEVYDRLIAYCNETFNTCHSLQISECQQTRSQRAWLVIIIDKDNHQIDTVFVMYNNGVYSYTPVRYGAR